MAMASTPPTRLDCLPSDSQTALARLLAADDLRARRWTARGLPLRPGGAVVSGRRPGATGARPQRASGRASEETTASRRTPVARDLLAHRGVRPTGHRQLRSPLDHSRSRTAAVEMSRKHRLARAQDVPQTGGERRALLHARRSWPISATT